LNLEFFISSIIMNGFRNKLTSILAFLAISVLLLGGLAWATRAALKLEEEHRLTAANSEQSERLFQLRKERADRLRLVLWRLDSRMVPSLAREESRPYPQYLPLYTPFPAVTGAGVACAPGDFFLPSPLLTAEIPDWMTLHFQVDDTRGWTSPQVIPDEIQKKLRKQPIELAMNNVTDSRASLLKDLAERYPADSIAMTFRNSGITIVGNEQEPNHLEELSRLVAALKMQQSNEVNNSYSIATQAPFPPSPPPIPPQPQPNTGQIARAVRVSVIQAPSQNSLAPNTNNPVVIVNGNVQEIPPEHADWFYRNFSLTRARKEGQKAFFFDDNRANYSGASTIFAPRGQFKTVDVQLSEMHPIWLPSAENPEHLIMVRAAKVGDKPVYQGFLLDWPKLQDMLKDEIIDLFPNAQFQSLSPGEPPHPDRAMSALPVEFDPNDPAIPEEAELLTELPPAGWTPLRIGLTFAWAAALIALVAVGLGGWSLLELSERRIRFVSAVTHELRTPLTTLRLYLDLLSSGMITEEKQKAEYLVTLNSEADRLHRLIGNVLDFARLEKSRPSVNMEDIEVEDVLQSLGLDWTERCAAAGKELVLENSLPPDALVRTDSTLVAQILSNLIDNAQKYSREAVDPRIILRAKMETEGIVFEVEDRGPGVTKCERSSIFRPFQRGHDADVKAGGVGLGLALATRWTHVIGGRLDLRAGDENTGACFRLIVPA
jgi:signal transduction histidine kinase